MNLLPQLPAANAVPGNDGLIRYPLVKQSQPDTGTATISLDGILLRLWISRKALLIGALSGTLVLVVLSSFSKPVYRARTAIRLEELNERLPNLPETLNEGGIPDDTYLQNELKVIESDSLAKRVAVQLDLKPAPSSTGIFSRKDSPKLSFDDLRINQVHRALTVRPSLKSQVVEVFFDSDIPVLAAKGANTVISEYVAMNREGRVQNSRDSTERLAEQTSDLKRRLDQGNEELKAFARSSGLLYGANQNLLSEEKARQIQEQLSRARVERAAKQSAYEAALANPQVVLPSNTDNALLRDLETRLAAKRTELVQLKTIYTSSHYKVVEAEALATQLELAVNAERRRIVAQMRLAYDAAERFESSLTSINGAHQRELIQQVEAAFRYNALKRDLDSTELLYNSLRQKAKEAGVMSAMRAVNVSVIDPARPPAKPRSPNFPLNSSIGFFTGLITTAGIVLIRNRDAYLADQNDDPDQLMGCQLGTIPLARPRTSPHVPSRFFLPAGRQTPSIELVTWYGQPSFLTEAFRATAISILFSPLLDRQRHLILTVTSAHAREGKTTTVSNLGIALAETHGRVLLIDADLRSPRIHEIFGHCNDRGLSTILSGAEPIPALNFASLIHPTKIPGLFTLPSGPGAPAITPLLHSVRLAAFLARVRNEFDYVLIDTAPASLFSDARILGRHSDGVVTVVHAGKVTRSEINTLCANFLKDGTRVVGTVVNCASVRLREYENYKSLPA